ncbi:MAG: carboxylesterase family protein [Alphaproteobacteria bacterium]|nr:carboxylesterase family protein [Alphaproteobacteria bacterium]
MMSFRRLVASGATAAFLALSPSYCAGPAASAPSGPIVNAPAGQLAGLTEGTLHIFKGIPYAEPPIGSMRWKPPAPMPRWRGVRQATEFGAACFQPKPKVPNIYTADLGRMSEDCLTLNIWAPAGARDMPIFFWIHGGALWGDASKDPLYNGARIAARGHVIVVSINYRLGVLGWLAHPELSAESPLGISGNYGLLDQIQALKWVKQNIGAFGGDPAKVTIVGESAGGLSVMYLMASPEARGLFSKAIAESSYMVSTPLLKEGKYGAPSAEQSGLALAKAVNASNLAALRAMDPGVLTEDAAANRFAPFAAVDGHVLTHQITKTFGKGEEAPVPILAGFNSGEIRSLRVLAPQPPASAAEYESVIHSQYGDLADEFLRLYPSTNLEESILATTRDMLYGWSAERLVRQQTALGKASYLYFWDHGYPAADEAHLHGFHASELPYVFGNLDSTPPLWPKVPQTPEQRKLSDAMIGYWTSFVRTGKPVAANEPDWPAYGSTSAYMDFTDAPHPAEHVLPGMYKFNEEVVCRRWASGDQGWNWNVGIWAPKIPPQSPKCQ